MNFGEVEQIMFDYKTYGLAIKNLREDKTKPELLEAKIKNRERIEEILLILTAEEKIIWEEKYMKNKDASYIYDTHCWSKTTYFRLRKGLVLKFMKCLGTI